LRCAAGGDHDLGDAAACERFGYAAEQVEFRLYVGRFAAPTQGHHDDAIRQWCDAQHVGAGAIKVVGLSHVASAARSIAAAKTYRDNAALTAIKVLDAARMLTPIPS
jgi:hypothetical protein